MLSLHRQTIILIASLLLSTLPTASIVAQTTTTDDGLPLQSETKHEKTYVKQDVIFQNYKFLNFEELTLEFKENWIHDYNRDQRTLSSQLQDKDVEDIKGRLKKQFETSFFEQLKANDRYSLVQTKSAETLLIKPSIVDLFLYGPDKQTATSKITMVHQAGGATLVLEIYDANSGELLAKIIDEKKTFDHFDLQQADRIFNNSEFSTVYRKWARKLLEVIK